MSTSELLASEFKQLVEKVLSAYREREHRLLLKTMMDHKESLPSTSKPEAGRFAMIWRIFTLMFSALLLVGAAYIFRENNLATVPLVGLVAVLVLWPLWEKLQSLSRIQADFSPTKVSMSADATEGKDDLVRLKSQLAKMQVELEIQKTRKELEKLQSSNEDENDSQDTPFLLDAAEESKPDHTTEEPPQK